MPLPNKTNLLATKKLGRGPAFFRSSKLHGRTQTGVSAIKEQANNANDAKASNGSN
jgi:hypothetical protein